MPTVYKVKQLKVAQLTNMNEVNHRVTFKKQKKKKKKTHTRCQDNKKKESRLVLISAASFRPKKVWIHPALVVVV